MTGPADVGRSDGPHVEAGTSGLARSPESFLRSPNPITGHYRAFRVGERLLFTGHSHQAWPDVAFRGIEEAWRDAAAHLDEKWTRVEERSEAVRAGYRRLLGGCDGDLALDQNTHALLVRFLSALPLRERPRLVTTTGEFHTIRRQLDRLAETGLEVIKVPAEPVSTLAERVAARVDDRTSAALVSSVLYERGLVVPRLGLVHDACARHGAEMLVDAYHHLNALPFDPSGLERAFVVGGGYKYAQLGEGVCVMRIPTGCALRPVVTGWFAEFGEVAEAGGGGSVRYAAGAARFAGSTFDPVSRYRAAAVFDFFRSERLEVPLLRGVSQLQVGRLVESFRGLDLDPRVVSLDDEVPISGRGGFLGVRAPEAGRISAALRERGVRTDFRGETLRFGPAPYLTATQIVGAMEALGEVVREGVSKG